VWTVPEGVFVAEFDLVGGGGGNTLTSQAELGGRGGILRASMAVTPGDTYYVHVGGRGLSSFSGGLGGINGGGDGGGGTHPGGGGGGATDIRHGADDLAHRILVAGGGGGNGGPGSTVDLGSPSGGAGGSDGNGIFGSSTAGGGNGGGGGTATAGGPGGFENPSDANQNGVTGTSGVGGTGGTAPGAFSTGGGGGGGGGGWFGGGGGAGADTFQYAGGGGGGGSGYAASGITVISRGQTSTAVDGSVTIRYTITDTPPTISGDPPATVAVGEDVEFFYTRHGTPVPTVSYTGDLPPGLTLTAYGLLSGTPTTTGTYNWTATVENSSGTDDIDSTMTVVDPFAPTITGSPPTSGIVGDAVDFTYTVTGAPAPTFMQAGALPPGLALEGAHLHGTLTTPGIYQFTVTVTNSEGSASVDSTIGVVGEEPVLDWTPPTGTVGEEFGPAAMDASGIPFPHCTLGASTPPGLSLDAGSCTWSGTPTEAGSFPVTVIATNPLGSDSWAGQIVVQEPAGDPATISGSPPVGAVPEPYSYAFTVGGDPAATVSLLSGSLPPGLTLSSAGVLSGTATKAGSYPFTVQADNGFGTPATDAVTLTIQPWATVSAVNVGTREGRSGLTPLTFTVVLSRASTLPISVHWQTGNGTAVAARDYVAGSGYLSFPAGQTTRTVTVMVRGDRLREANEYFLLKLRSPSPAVKGDNVARGTIINDD
jgi:hypothetical protein